MFSESIIPICLGIVEYLVNRQQSIQSVIFFSSPENLGKMLILQHWGHIVIPLLSPMEETYVYTLSRNYDH